LAGQDGAADRAILPQIDPRLGNRIGRRLVEEICLGGIVQGDVGDAVALFVVDGQGASSYERAGERIVTISPALGNVSSESARLFRRSISAVARMPARFAANLRSTSSRATGFSALPPRFSTSCRRVRPSTVRTGGRAVGRKARPITA